MNPGSDPPPETGAASRGAYATGPFQFGWHAWRDILARVWRKTGRHDIGFLAAGVAFYGLLSLVPLLAAIVMLYGLVADPAEIERQMTIVMVVVPRDVATLIDAQLADLIGGAHSTKGIGLAVAMLISVYGASRGASAMISSLNIIYEQEEKRGLVRLALVALALISGMIAIGLFGLASASVLGFLETLIGAVGAASAVAVRILTWLLAAALASATIAAIYRYGPCRQDAKWRWLSIGSVAATLLWLLGSILFGYYAAWFGHYEATYGSLGAAVVLLMWLYVSAYAILLGAFVDAEAERQTAQDSTTEPDRPMGRRGAVVADMSAAEQNDGLPR